MHAALFLGQLGIVAHVISSSKNKKQGTSFMSVLAKQEQRSTQKESSIESAQYLFSRAPAHS